MTFCESRRTRCEILSGSRHNITGLFTHAGDLVGERDNVVFSCGVHPLQPE